MDKSNGIAAIRCVGEERLRRLERLYGRIVVEVRVIEPCKQFAIKDIGF
jgi:hypothetical protein